MRLGGVGGWEWIIILVIVILIFGVGKLPQTGAALGQTIRGFRKALSKPDEDEPKTDEPANEKA